MQPASNQTGDDNENSSEDEGPDDGAESGSWAGSDAELASGDDEGSDNLQHLSSSEDDTGSVCHSSAPHTKKIILERGADSKNICCGTVRIPAMMQ